MTESESKTGVPRPLARSQWRRAALSLLPLILVVVAFKWSGVADELSVAGIRSRVDMLGWVAPAVYLCLTAGCIGIGTPGTVFVIIGLLGFGELYGATMAIVSASVGCTAATAWLRRLGGTPFTESGNVRIQKLVAFVTRRPILGSAAIRLTLLLSPLGHAALAFVGVRSSHVLLGSLLGLTPVVFAVALLTNWGAELLGVEPSGSFGTIPP